MNKVSVLIATYNAEKYIKKTLKSCLGQAYGDFEVLVLDNGSKDNTVKIIEKIGDRRVKLFKSKENLGAYEGLNFLLEKARGDYIAIQDHDDIWFPGKIKKQIEFLDNNKDFIACGTNTLYYYESQKVLILNSKPTITDFVDHPSLMFKNKGFRYDTSRTLTDEYFEKKILTKEGKIACVQECLAIHRIKSDGSNLSSSRFSLSFRNIKELLSTSGLSLKTLLYLFDLIIRRFFPNKLLWIIRRKVTQRNRSWIVLKDFKSKHPQIDL